MPKTHLFPDEDFVCEAIAANTGRERLELQAEVDPLAYGHLAEHSITRTGNAAIECVFPEAIIDYRVFSQPDTRLWMIAGGDSIPSVRGYYAMGAYYRHCITLLFEHERDEALKQMEAIERTVFFDPDAA